MKKLICVLLLLPLFSTVCHAEGIDRIWENESDLYAVEEALTEEEKEISGSLRLDGGYDSEGALKRLWESAMELARERLNRELGFCVRLVILALFCALAGTLTDHQRMRAAIEICGCCAAAFMIAGDFDGLIRQASDAVTRLTDYSRVSMSVIFSAAAASGAVGAAAARYAAASLAMDVMMSASERFILPAIQSFAALSISRSLFDNTILQGIAKALKWCAIMAMTALTLLFTLYLSVTGLVASSADAVAVKTAKTVISTALPVVGGILSDSAGVVLAAASLIKNSVGVFSLIAVCALCIGPFIHLGIKMLLFKAAAAVSDMLPGGRLSALIRDLGTVFGMLLGLVGCCGIMLFFSIFAGIRTVAA